MTTFAIRNPDHITIAVANAAWRRHFVTNDADLNLYWPSWIKAVHSENIAKNPSNAASR